MKIIKGKEKDYAKWMSLKGKEKAYVDYAKRWAELMEIEIEKGTNLEFVAGYLRHKANNKKIIIFIAEKYIVSTLSKIWIHGEELKKWYDSK